MGNSPTIEGVSIARIDKLMLDVIDYAEKSNKIINQLQLLVRETSDYFISPAGDQYRKKFFEYCSEASTVNKNILTYNEDLLKVKLNYNNISLQGAELIKSAQQKITNKNIRGEEK